jgi:hypothetical protein
MVRRSRALNYSYYYSKLHTGEKGNPLTLALTSRICTEIVIVPPLLQKRHCRPVRGR